MFRLCAERYLNVRGSLPNYTLLRVSILVASSSHVKQWEWELSPPNLKPWSWTWGRLQCLHVEQFKYFGVLYTNEGRGRLTKEIGRGCIHVDIALHCLLCWREVNIKTYFPFTGCSASFPPLLSQTLDSGWKNLRSKKQQKWAFSEE